MKNKTPLILVALLLILTLSACTNSSDSTPDPQRELVLVNGEPIIQEDFDKQYNESLAYVETYTEITPTLEKELKNDVLDTMIRNLLLTQQANADDYTPKDEEVEELYQLYVKQYDGEEQLESALAERDFTVEDFREDLELQLNIDHYLKKYIEDNNMIDKIVVTDKEIEDEFLRFSLNSGQEGLKISDYYDAIKYSLEEQKMIGIVNEITDTLIADSEIEYLVEFEK